MYVKFLGLLFLVVLKEQSNVKATNSIENLNNRCYIPDGCEFAERKKWKLEAYIVCKDMSKKLDFKAGERKLPNCSEIFNYIKVNLIFEGTTNYILNNSFELQKMINYFGNSTFEYRYKFVNMAGLDINLTLNIKEKSSKFIRVEFYDLDFSLYNKGKRVLNCDDLTNSSGNFLFIDRSQYFSATFINTLKHLFVR